MRGGSVWGGGRGRSTYCTAPYRTIRYYPIPCNIVPCHSNNHYIHLQLNLDIVRGNRHHCLAHSRERPSQEAPHQVHAPSSLERLFSSVTTAAAAIAATFTAAVMPVPPLSASVVHEPVGSQCLGMERGRRDFTCMVTPMRPCALTCAARRGHQLSK